MIEETIATQFKAHAGLAALIGTQFYPSPLPHGVTAPAVTYERISTAREYTHDGFANLTRVRFQFNCWASTYKLALQIAYAVRDAIHAFTGGKGNFAIDQRDMRDPDTQLFNPQVDAIFWYTEV